MLDFGFYQDGFLDRLGAGPELAFLLPNADRVADVADDDLTGSIRGWRRLASWTAAMEHAAVAELAGRRMAEARSAGACTSEAVRFAAAEVAAALTLTRYSAEILVGRALLLADMPATLAALARGTLDVPRALVIVDGLTGLDRRLCQRVEEQVLRRAVTQTTSELRKAVARAVIEVDPAAADERRREAQKSARVERWAEAAGTAAIAGRDLPPTEVLAADNRINALAAALKADGAAGNMDQLRAKVFVGLLLGRSTRSEAGGTTVADHRVAGTTTPDPAVGPALSNCEAQGVPVPDPSHFACWPAVPGSAAPNHPPPDFTETASVGKGRAPKTGATTADLTTTERAPNGWALTSGSVNLTVPLATMLGLARRPGEVAGFGPVSPSTAAEFLATAAQGRAVRWCVTLTDGQGRPIGHGCGSRTPGKYGRDWTLTVKVRSIAVDDCAHERKSSACATPSALRHLIQVRHRTCVFPGCGRPARQCDLDHTIPYGDGGSTCECNLAPLCRFHHRVKQAAGWKLEQLRPGVMQWTTPAGWKYTVMPDFHPT